MKSEGSISSKYQFVGEQYDEALGSYYLRQRFYDSTLGRFLRKDTYEGGPGDLMNLNQYVYSSNNPVNYGDPTGLATGLLGELTATQILGGVLAGIGAVGTYINYQSSLMPVAEALVDAFARAMEMSLSTARNLNRRFRIPIVIWGNDLPETTQHQFKALTFSGYTSDNPSGSLGQSSFISPVLVRNTPHPRYVKGKGYKGNWYDNFCPCQGRGQGSDGKRLVCDEYPYASTRQGGEANYLAGKVSIAPVPAYEQSLRGDGQGGRLSTFYRLAGIPAQDRVPGAQKRNSTFVNLAFPSLGASFWLDRDGNPRSF